MSYFSGIFSSAAKEEAGQPQGADHRPRTRSQTRGIHLELPSSNNAVNTFNGIARGRRTPSPRAVGHNANSAVVFAYDSTNISQRILQSQEQVDIPNSESSISLPPLPSEMSNASAIEELRAAAAAAVEAANAATSALAAAANLVSQQGAQQQPQIRTRKPDLPEFDAKNIEIWIKRTEAAYDRAGICLPKDKFAFLESKFAVGANPSIDSFLYGPANEETWSAFLTYLREEYGRTIRQEAQFLRAQHSRDGRRPSQMLAHIREKVKRVKVDDVLKEIIVSSLPSDVQQMLAERIKDATAEETAAMADKYFDQEGKQLHSRAPPIQHINEPTIEEIYEDDDTDINAINGRRNFRPRGGSSNNNRFSRPFNNTPRFNNNNASGPPNRMGVKNRSFPSGAPSDAAPNSSSTSSSGSAAASSSKPKLLCLNHQRHGDNTISCQPGCSRWKEMRRGNAPTGNRM